MDNETGNSSTDRSLPAPIKEPSFYERNRLLIKGLLVGVLILLMLIPAAYISNLISERASRQAEVINEVSSKWAAAQTITGPVLVVPYSYNYKSGDKIISSKKWVHLLPDDLKINGDVLPEVRHRSLYDVTLYRSDLQLSGRFKAQSLASLNIAPETILWGEAVLLFGINDARGLQDDIALRWGDVKTRFEAGVPENNAIKEGLSVIVPMSGQSEVPFDIRLNLRGSENLNFIPVGRNTEVTLTSTWPHPDFSGKYIPDVPATITNKGFKAHWKILQASRPYPQAWKDGTPDLRASSFGVHLIQPADGYAKTERSVKYAILFIGLTFIVFFFLEILQRRQIHPLQYLLVGFALCIFYTLLLSISEYLGFNSAYLVAATATVALTGLYTWNVFQSGKTAIGFTLSLGGLYSYIFILIQLEDYALLFGSIGLFVILAVIMYFSRRIDWYGIGRHHQPAVV